MPQRTSATMNTDATTYDTMNEYYNEQFLSIKSGCYKEHTCYNKQFVSIKSGCYNERGGILSADVARECA
jgi:hypothetical protein